MLRTTLARRRSPLPMGRPPLSSRSLALNRNSYSFPMTSLEPTSSMLKPTAHRPSLLRRSRTPNLPTPLVSRPSSSSIQLAVSLSFPMSLESLALTPMPPGAASRPFLVLSPPPVRLPASSHRPPVPAVPKRPSRMGLRRVTPLPPDSSESLFCSPS